MIRMGVAVWPSTFAARTLPAVAPGSRLRKPAAASAERQAHADAGSNLGTMDNPGKQSGDKARHNSTFEKWVGRGRGGAGAQLRTAGEQLARPR